MEKRPILFSDAMVRAILSGRKIQTRRVVKPSPMQIGDDDSWMWRHRGLDAGYCHTRREPMINLMLPFCPYGQPGDQLWVREAFAPAADNWGAFSRRQFLDSSGPDPTLYYRADGGDPFIEKWLPSIHMPLFASRIVLQVTGRRVERVQEINEADACAEGVEPVAVIDKRLPAHKFAFQILWNTINAARGAGWDLNPWVWVIEFKRVS